MPDNEVEDGYHENLLSVENPDTESYMVFESKGSTKYSIIDGFLLFVLILFLFYYLILLSACSCCSVVNPISSFTALTIPLLALTGLHLIDKRTVKIVRFIDGGIVEFVLFNKKSHRIDLLRIQKIIYSFGLIIVVIDNKKIYFNCRKMKDSYIIINEIAKLINIQPNGNDFFDSVRRVLFGISGYMLIIYALMFYSSENEEKIPCIDGDKQFIASNTIGDLRIVPRTNPVEEIYKPVLYYKAPGVDIKEKQRFIYQFLSHQLVYCPMDGSYVASIDDKGRKRQVTLKDYIKKDESVFNISSFAGDNIIVNTILKEKIDKNVLFDRDLNYLFEKIKPVRAFCVNINTGKISDLSGFIQVNSNYKSANYAALEADKKSISIVDINNRVLYRVKLKSPLIGNWDYDGVNNMIACITNESASVTLINPITKKMKRFDVIRRGYDISLQPDSKQIWVSTTGNRENILIRKDVFNYYYTSFDYCNEIAVYDYEGRYLGVRIKADAIGYSVKPMMNADKNKLILYNVCEKNVRRLMK